MLEGSYMRIILPAHVCEGLPLVTFGSNVKTPAVYCD